jgi:hypothetical protein
LVNPILYDDKYLHGTRQVMTVLDVKDIRFMDITSDVISFIKQSADIMDNYYPGRVRRYYYYYY